MRQQLTLAGLAALLISQTGCVQEIGFFCERGSGEVITQELQLEDIVGFDLQFTGDVYLTQGETQQITLEGQANILELLAANSEVRNGIWEIDTKQCIRTNRELNIYITVPTLEVVRLSGTGDVIGQTEFVDLDELECTISGTGDLEMVVAANRLDLTTSGTGSMDLIADVPTITARSTGTGSIKLNLANTTTLEGDLTGTGDLGLAGNLTTADLRSTGAGDIEAFECQMEECSVRLEGTGNADLTVSDQLDIVITGSGDVTYQGNPVINVQITGTGSVRQN